MAGIEQAGQQHGQATASSPQARHCPIAGRSLASENLPRYEAADLAPGAAIVAIFKPFLLDLLRGNPSKRTFNRHRDNLWLLGGEMIRRRYQDSDLKRLPIDKLIRQLIEADGGPLISPRISETEQNAIDATCRKLYRFLNHSTSVE
jgi:hypothetical protein